MNAGDPASPFLASFKPGDHLCCLFESDEEHHALLAPFLRRGLEIGEKVVYIADSPMAESVCRYMGNGHVVGPALNSGQFQMITPEQAYLRNGYFDPEAMIGFFRGETERASREGYPALRVCGETYWSLKGLPGCNRLIEYESKLNWFFPSARSLALCEYDRRRIPPEILQQVLATHPQAIIDRQLYDNFYYVPPDEFLREDSATAVLDRSIRNLAERQRLTDELRRWAEELEDRVRRRTEELARSNAELQQFAYIASHDLQEPLRMVANFTKLLAARYRGMLDERADQYIRFAVEGANRMSELIGALLQYSRVQTGAEELQPVALADPLRRCLANLRLAISEAAAKIAVEPLPTVLGDAVQLTRVFQNLLSNSIKFRSAAPPRIRVSARDAGGQWEIAVADNGIGMDPVHCERVFRMFQRLNPRADYSGTGVGLTICRKIVERHGGLIRAESTAGNGTTIYFTLAKA